MKNLISKYAILCVFLILSVSALAQTSAEPTSTVTKKTVQIAGKWYIETTTTAKQYTELTTEYLLKVDEDDADEKRDEEEVKRKQEERAERKKERVERNQLLREAMQKGYKPEPKTLEEQEKLRKTRAKLGIK